MISWVADHRKHHTFSDEQGDPHSPHVGHGGGWRGARAACSTPTSGWLFIHTNAARSALRADLIETRWSASSTGRSSSGPWSAWRSRSRSATRSGATLVAGLTGLLWGGAVRVFLLHHVTYSINSRLPRLRAAPVRHR